MDPNRFYEEIRIKYQAKIAPSWSCSSSERIKKAKKHRKWWQKLRILRKTKTQPKPWD